MQESGVKIELLEKRMETVKKQADQANEEILTKTRSQEQMYAEALENLQTEFDALEQENLALKKNAAKKEEKRLSVPKKTEYDLLEDGSGLLENENVNVFEMNGQLESLKAAIRYLRAENAHLKGTDVIRRLDLDSSGALTNKKSVDPQTQALMRSFAIETRMLVKDLRTVSATPKVIQLSKDRKGGKWQSEKRLPDYQYQTQQSVLYTLKQRCDQLKEKMVHVQAPPVRQQQEKVLENVKNNLISLAKIQLPTIRQNGGNKRCIQLQSLIEFEKIHSIFIR